MKIKLFATILTIITLLTGQTGLAVQPETLKSIQNDATFWSGVSSPCGTSNGGSNSGSGDEAGGVITKSVGAFVDTYGKMAYENSLKTGVPYDFTLGQAIIESGYGQSDLTKKANNFFGIKGEFNGQSITMRTREESSSGASYYVNAQFRKYPSPQDSFNDHDRLFRTAPRYKEALKYPNDPIAFLTEVKKAGYATDSKYVATVGSVIRNVQAYIASKNLYPPSSEVIYTIEPIAGSTSASSSTTTSAGDCPGRDEDISKTYKNPLRNIKELQPIRVGSGVQFSGNGKMYPIGKATVVLALTNATDPNYSFISYKVLEGQAAGKIIYISGKCSSGIKKDDTLDTETALCQMTNQEPFTEVGWANDTGTGPADITTDDQYSAYGTNFRSLLIKLGAPTGSVGDAQRTSTVLPTGWPSWE